MIKQLSTQSQPFVEERLPFAAIRLSSMTNCLPPPSPVCLFWNGKWSTYGKNKNSKLYQALADAVMRANLEKLKEGLNMCEALKELFADNFKESELKGRNEGRTEGAASKIIELVIKKHQKGDPIPSMRSLAKSIHVSVITVQRAYEDLQRDGFIETTVGRGSFVSAQNKDFIKEEKQKQIEEHLLIVVDMAKSNGIDLEKLIDLLSIFYLREDS